MTVPVEQFTDEERERLAPHFTNLDRPVFGLVNLPETVKGAMFARYSRYPGRCGGCSSTSSPTRCPWSRRSRGRRTSARPSSTRGSSSATATTRSRSSAARTSRGMDVEPADEDPPAAAPRRLPRAVDALHRVRRAARRLRLPVPPRPALRPEYERAMTTCSRVLPLLEGTSAWVGERFPAARTSRPPRTARRPREGARPRAGAAAGGLALAHGHLRERPGVRAARPASARAPARRGDAYGGCCSRSCRRSSRAL